jgi:hypothetical protein
MRKSFESGTAIFLLVILLGFLVGIGTTGFLVYKSVNKAPVEVTNSNSPQSSSSAQPVSKKTAEFILNSTKTVKVGDQFQVLVQARSDQETVNLFAAYLNFSQDKLQVVRLETEPAAKYIVKLWADQKFNNDQGTVSLIGGLPTPGYQSAKNQQPGQIATIVFKAVSPGSAEIALGEKAAIYSNTTNVDVLKDKEVLKVEIAH